MSADPAQLDRLRWTAFALGCAAFFLSFFHRVSTGAIASELQREFQIGATALGTLGATYFYVYALMQVPTGVLADTLGPRATLTVGMLIAGIGSLAYGLAPDFGTAAVARTLVGLGVSVVFVCTLKLHSRWFDERRFATATGASNVSGIVGALTATAPLAWLVTQVSWRSVFVALGAISLVVAVAIGVLVRDAPSTDMRRVAHADWGRALRAVAGNPATWPPFWVNFSISGAYLTFVGLWAAPFLIHAHGMAAVAASRYTGLTLLGFACCVPAVGWLSDRAGVRRPFVLGGAVAFTLTGVFWFALPAPSPAAAAVAALATGLVAPFFTLSWAIAKEVNPPERAGMAIAVANIGGFLASGILQPLVGWVVDHGAGTIAGGSADAYRLGIGVLAAWSVIGIVAATRLTETNCRSVWRAADDGRH